MKRLSYLTVAVTGLGLACSVAQADLKDPIPDSLSLGGVTVYGTVDVGYAYQSHGVPINGQLPGGLEYQAFTTTRNYAGSVSTVAESGLEQSKVGIRVSEPIGDEFSFVAQAETGFNPLSAQLTDACNSLATNAGKPQGEQTANADSSRCGQAFNSVLYGGTSSKDYGTLTIGRQNSLQLAQLLQYDPQQLSYAFSFLGYSGFNGGSGSTQAARWDNSVLYAYRNSMFHVAAMYGNGGQDTGYFGKAYGADVGVTWQGLSVDATYQKINSAVNLRSSFDDGTANPLPTPGLAAYVSTNTSYNVMGKYTLEFGDAAQKDKITFYAGYSHIQKAHGDYTTGGAEGSYPIDVDVNINSDAEYNMEWLGARYTLNTNWNFIGAYYHVTQNSWTIGLLPTGNQGIGCAAGAGLLCSGDFNEASGTVDYVFNKHYDLYAGVNWSEVTDGLASGFITTNPKIGTTGSENEVTFMVGGRVKF